MHEFSIVSGIVERVLEFLVTEKVSRVIAVRLAVGEFTFLEAEQMRFCYSAITQETGIEGSVLDVEMVAATVTCPHCQYQGRPKYWDDALAFTLVPTLQCPACGKAAEAAQGHECTIKSIQFVR
jgi:hydrogenase nickel incorporation protein HypA/HybF